MDAPPTGPASAAGPTTARTALVALAGVPFTAGFRANLGPRPPLSAAGVLSAVAGALLAMATALVTASGDDPSPWLLVTVGALLVLGGWIIAFVLGLRPPHPMAPSADGLRLGALVPGATLLALVGVWIAVTGLLVETLSDTLGPSDSAVWWPQMLAAVVLGALWLLPGLQGRPALLGAALLSWVYAVAGFVAVQVGGDELPDIFRDSSGGMAVTSTISPFGLIDADGLRAAAIAAFALGLLLLVLAALVDRLGLPGLGTPLLVVGAVTALAGSFGVVQGNRVVQSLLPAVVVLLIGAVGVSGRRKATTWIAGLALVPALVQVTVALLGDDVEPALAGVVLALLGLLALAAAVGVLALRLDDRRGADVTSP